MSSLRVGLIECVIAIAGCWASAQQTPPLTLHSIAELPLRTDGPVFRRYARAGEPFTVAGPQGVIVGQQQGPFEAWILPIKFLSHLTVAD